MMCPELSVWRRGKVTSLLDLFSTSNIPSANEERCVGFPRAGESCAPAPGKLFGSAGERSHSFSVEKNV